METLFNKKYLDVVAKKAKLDEATAKLKKQFVGLDNIIDGVMDLVSAWYIFPGAQTRPCVINLWGLTGSGKTALVNALIDELDHRKLYAQFDMGECRSSGAYSLRLTFTEELTHFSKQQPVICLDEFQFARSIDKDSEVNTEKFRIVWELLDSGKIRSMPDANQYYVKRAEMAIDYLHVFKANGGKIKDGEVVEGGDIFMRLFDSFFFDNNVRHDSALDLKYLKSDDFIDGLMTLDDITTARDNVLKQVRECDVDQLIQLIRKLIDRALTPGEIDLSHSLIFVLGNLDEAYRMSANLDPDISADDMHEATKKLTTSDIKIALKKRFRAEQVARLGNNHFLYAAFSKAQFTEIIRRELNRLTDFAMNEFGWKIVFDESVVSTIYSEGVIPSQGTRPVLTTINNLVQARMGKLAMNVSCSDKNVNAIRWSMEDESFHYQLIDADDNIITVIKEELNLELYRRRASVKPHIQAHIAVHESGHAILAALMWRILPSVVVSRTASPGFAGFCRVRFPEGPMTRDSLLIDIAVTLGGLAAEKLIFGNELTSAGVGSDIEWASTLANDAIRRWGMGNDPIRLAVVRNFSNEDYFFSDSLYEDEAVRLIRDCMSTAERILDRNKLLLLKMSDYLTKNSRMETAHIKEFVKNYSTEDWVNETGFIEPGDYYAFDKIIEAKLVEVEEQEIILA
ncbi:MAG: hypothetical protein WDO14_00260 [Bacteroidota bacterium]